MIQIKLVFKRTLATRQQQQQQQQQQQHIYIHEEQRIHVSTI